MAEWLDYHQAAALVHRSERSIRGWQKDGMPMHWDVRDGQRVRVVEKATLQAWFRDRLKSSPIIHAKRRRHAREVGLPDPIWEGTGARRDWSDDDRVIDAPGKVLPWKIVWPDLLFDRGRDEWRELQHALETVEPGCRGVDEFTADRVDADTKAQLASICAACPVLELCRAYVAAAQPKSGYWPDVSASPQKVRRIS